jgi:hypothetical protein
VRRNGVELCPQPLFEAIAAGRPVDIGVLPSGGCSY